MTRENAKLHIERHSAMVDSLRVCRVLVSGREVGQIRNGEARTFDVAPGPQEIELRMGSTASNVIPVCAESGEDFVVESGSPDRIPRDIAPVLKGLRLSLILWPSFDLPLAWFGRGFVLAMSETRMPGIDPIERCRDALAAFDAGIAAGRDDAVAHFHAAMVSAQLGLPEARVVARFDRAIELYPRYVDAHLNRGVALESNREEALRSVDCALAIEPEYADAHFRRSELLRAMGRNEDALISVERAFGLDPGLYEASELRRRIVLDLGRPDPNESEFGALFLAEFHRLSGGYGAFKYREIQEIKGFDRDDFARYLRRSLGLGALATLDGVAPDEVAARYHQQILMRAAHGGAGGMAAKMIWMAALGIN